MFYWCSKNHLVEKKSKFLYEKLFILPYLCKDIFPLKRLIKSKKTNKNDKSLVYLNIIDYFPFDSRFYHHLQSVTLFTGHHPLRPALLKQDKFYRHVRK